ncbi:hypothetical protein H0B42_29500 [Rhodococcus aetherivorans]|nr:hypothetical protein [Rhodococcus aetherivorans]
MWLPTAAMSASLTSCSTSSVNRPRTRSTTAPVRALRATRSAVTDSSSQLVPLECQRKRGEPYSVAPPQVTGEAAILDVAHHILAEIATDLEAGISLLDRATVLLNAGELSAVDAAQAKYWLSDMHNKVVDRCVQLHGGYGYMLEYPIAKAYADARILPIYGGTNESMKEVIGRDIAARTPSQ